MIKSNDIEKIEFNINHFIEGLDYALISWTSTFNRMGKPNPYSRISKIILGIMAELAFVEWLKKSQIKFDTTGKTKWYEVDRYDIGIKNFAIDVKANFLDLSTQYIQNKLNNLSIEKMEWFLKFHALVPLDQFNPGKSEKRVHSRDKIYVFPFLEGAFKPNYGNDFLVHAFWDYKWLKRAEYKTLSNLGNLEIKYNGNLNKSKIKIYGTTSKNKICIEDINLNSKSLTTKNDFYQVFSILWNGEEPTGNLIIHSPIFNLTETIYPIRSFSLHETENGYWPIENNWQNILIQDFCTYLFGWVDEEELRIDGKKIPRFTHSLEQYSETKVDNWGILVNKLEPMSKLRGL